MQVSSFVGERIFAPDQVPGFFIAFLLPVSGLRRSTF